MSNVVTVAWARYLRQLEREPLKTKVVFLQWTPAKPSIITNNLWPHTTSTSLQAITSGSLAALSDITAQKLVSNAPLNWRRTLAMALFGLIWSGPSNHYWQKFTNQLFKGKKDAASVAQKVQRFSFSSSNWPSQVVPAYDHKLDTFMAVQVCRHLAHAVLLSVAHGDL